MLINIFKQIFNHPKDKLSPVNYSRKRRDSIGDRCKIYSLHPSSFGSGPYCIPKGNDVIITADMKLITFDGSTFLFRGQYPDLGGIGSISVGNDKPIGMKSIIKLGLIIGEKCVALTKLDLYSHLNNIPWKK